MSKKVKNFKLFNNKIQICYEENNITYYISIFYIELLKKFPDFANVHNNINKGLYNMEKNLFYEIKKGKYYKLETKNETIKWLERHEKELIEHMESLPCPEILHRQETREPMSQPGDRVIVPFNSLYTDSLGRLPFPMRWLADKLLGYPIDRSGFLYNGFYKIIHEMPEDLHTDKSFEQICEERAIEIIEKTRDFEKVDLYWSGGIDSTVVFIALMKVADEDFLKRFWIRFAPRSLEEYPLFFDRYIKDKMKWEVLDGSVPKCFRVNKYPAITGELGDQCMGSFGAENYGLPQDNWKKALTKDDQLSKRDFEFFERCLEQAPFKIEKLLDFFWWFNFTLKWQYVSLRILGETFFVMPISQQQYNNFFHFFNSDDFQRWACTRRDHMVQEDWLSYKWKAKEYILKFTGDHDYYKYKRKEGSLQWIHPPVIALDENFQIVNADGKDEKTVIHKKYGKQLQQLTENFRKFY